MCAPRRIKTCTFTDEAGSDVTVRSDGNCTEAFCCRRNKEGEVLEVCDYLTFFQDWVKPGKAQEHCFKDMPGRLDSGPAPKDRTIPLFKLTFTFGQIAKAFNKVFK